jgi:hypothetical protein
MGFGTWTPTQSCCKTMVSCTISTTLEKNFKLKINQKESYKLCDINKGLKMHLIS